MKSESAHKTITPQEVLNVLAEHFPEAYNAINDFYKTGQMKDVKAERLLQNVWVDLYKAVNTAAKLEDHWNGKKDKRVKFVIKIMSLIHEGARNYSKNCRRRCCHRFGILNG